MYLGIKFQDLIMKVPHFSFIMIQMSSVGGRQYTEVLVNDTE